MEAKRTMHEIPEDIVFDVLARLPAKTLCRLRCVCKGWRALISDPAFVAAQRSRADPHLVGVFLGPRNLPEVRVMDMDGNVVKAFEITRSTRQLAMRPDLICADETAQKFGRAGGRRGSTIIDPAAGEAFTGFGRDPSAKSYNTILGRAIPSGLFKVLRHGGGGPYPQPCEVATIMTGSGGGAAEPLTWRQKPAPPFVIGGCKPSHKAIVNGVAYFIQGLDMIDGEFYEVDDAAPNMKRIVAFDLESEEWKPEVINGPILGHVKEGDDIGSVSLVELNGTLAFVHKVFVNNNRYTSIWLLVDPDKSVWSKEYMIPMPKNHVAVKPLGVLVNGIILLWSSKIENERTTDYHTIRQRRRREVVLFYDPSTKAFTHFVEMAGEFRFTLVFYTGSLLS